MTGPSNMRLGRYGARYALCAVVGACCSLVDAFRKGERSPAEELEATYAAIEGSGLNAFSYLRARHREGRGGDGRRGAPVRRRAHRREGARQGRGLAGHGGIDPPARRAGRRSTSYPGVTPSGRRGRPRGDDDRERVRRRQPHSHEAERDHPKPLEPRSAHPAVRRAARRRPWPVGSSASGRRATAAAPSASPPGSPVSSA